MVLIPMLIFLESEKTGKLPIFKKHQNFHGAIACEIEEVFFTGLVCSHKITQKLSLQ